MAKFKSETQTSIARSAKNGRFLTMRQVAQANTAAVREILNSAKQASREDRITISAIRDPGLKQAATKK